MKISDGRGLHLFVQPTGTKLWRLAYRFAGKQKTLALGTYPAVSLSQARKGARCEGPTSQRHGPESAKKEAKKAAKMEAAESFESLRASGLLRGGILDSAYADRLMRRLEADVFSAVGPKPVSSIEPPELLGEFVPWRLGERLNSQATALR